MTVHCIRYAPRPADDCLSLPIDLRDGDAVVLIEDGVQWLRLPATLIPLIESGLTVSALEDDCVARNVPITDVPRISMADLVELCASHDKTISW
ncbi:hypothetical protein LJ739_05830 [Aestuariibacter halophilus]|uniref:Sulfurtransferase complex subunit TusB n=1 Tax=Fluctibacter halophilus TaxID=226011 RepID=A0ABS8G590_9ALTE|nr:DsrH/TusB family sulfur metabolism protein [Aestuariibacter halophilus]MCC2615752.1 hypothetical protein [Aestuariibacter halophilus]